MRSFLRRGLGLRARVVLAFGLSGLVLSGLLATVTYGVARNTSLDQRTRSAERQFIDNADLVGESSRAEDTSYIDLLQSLPQVAGGQSIANIPTPEDRWVAPGGLTPEDLPTPLVDIVGGSDGAYLMRYSNNSQPTLAFGIKLLPAEVGYYEVITLNEIADNLSSLALTLVLAAAGTTIAGAMLGVWASSRILSPIASVSSAAQAIAAGDLATRLEPRADPDLEIIVDSFNDMAAALERRIARDARFASDVSHELRSPLMTLRASIDVLDSRRHELSERSQAALDLLSDDVNRFQRLVEDLLEISRGDGGADIEVSTLNLLELVRNVTSFTGHDQIPMTSDDERHQPLIDGEKRRLFQVVSNLLDNADKYAGGATSIRVASSRDYVTLAIEDAGPGVPRDERQLVFERFARGGAARRRGAGAGAGLGLALVAEHVRMHNGSVWIEERLDRGPGARFVVELPRSEENDEA
jgi:signal transduction histidine kinase